MSRLIPLFGFMLAGAAAISFAANVTIARIAYDGGSNPLSYLTLRSALALAAVFVLLRVTRTRMDMPPRRRLAAYLLGLLMALYSYGVLAAIQYIPVALTTLIFYTYPLLTAAYLWTSGRERFTASGAAAVAIAFTGLALALDIGGDIPDTRGIALALLAAFGLTTVMLLNNRLVGGGDSRPVTLHMLTTASIAYALATLLLGRPALPATPEGWSAFLIGPLFYAFAIIAIFIVMSKLGPFRTALTMNLEPVSSVIFGFLLLGQTLGGRQLVGVALVVSAVVIVQLGRQRGPAPVRGETA